MSLIPYAVYCNGASRTSQKIHVHEPLVLDYQYENGVEPSIRVGLPKFVGSLYHLPDRILDLVEIASYIYCADRRVSRGSLRDLEYHGWSRSFQYIIKVRDFDFWRQKSVIDSLNELLKFLSGDIQHKLIPEAGHSTPPASLFDREDFRIEGGDETDVALFSGGLDSLGGVVDRLANTNRRMCLVSHRSYQPSISRTQKNLFRALGERFPGRLQSYPYICSLLGDRAPEESQRTRFFLYASIASAVARVYGKRMFYVFENGITSLNLPKREDLKHGRASRTTHPKTIELLSAFLSLVYDDEFSIVTPYSWSTKTDVLRSIHSGGAEDLISSSVSCSKTFKASIGHTQCGGCSQCVDRRFAVYAAGLAEYDTPTLYSLDFVGQKIEEDEQRATIIDYLTQAREFASCDINSFYKDWLIELTEIVDYVPGLNEEEKVEKIYKLCRCHGLQVMNALKNIQNAHDNPTQHVVDGSLMDIVNKREYLNSTTMNNIVDEKKSIQLFYSYAHEDEALRDELQKHLAMLTRESVISNLYDRMIVSGGEIDPEINEYMKSANVILLLVSSDFLNSDYCWNIEMNHAIARHESGTARVIPVILRECEWQTAPFGKLLAAPTDGKPITSRHWHNLDEAFTDVARMIRMAVEEIRGG